MPLATIVDPGYKIALFLHVLAVVLAFGPTFGYALFFSVAPQLPAGDAGDPRRGAEVRQIPGQPGHDRPAAGRDLPAESDGPWETSDAFISVGFLAIIVLFGLQHAFFQPAGAQGEGARRTRPEAGDTLSDEFEAVGAADRPGRHARRAHRRRDDLLHGVQAVPIADRLAHRSRCSTRASAGSPSCTSASSRCPRRTSSTSATPRGSPTAAATPSALRERIGAIAELLLGDAAPSCW